MISRDSTMWHTGQRRLATDSEKAHLDLAQAYPTDRGMDERDGLYSVVDRAHAIIDGDGGDRG